jgi:phosphate:Na+ symporter
MQSSSAFIAVVQVLAFKGAFGMDWDLVLRIVIPFILGSNIGTTITAPLAAIPASRNSKRAAMGHVIFNVVGTIYFLPLLWLGVYVKIVKWVTPWELSQNTIMVYMAIAHSVFNIVNTIVFLPGVRLLEAIVIKMIPVTKKELEEKPVVLERHLFSTPVFALEQAKREIIRMTAKAKEAVQQAIKGFLMDDECELEKARAGENVTDDFQFAITSYLVELSREQLSEEVSKELPVLLHTVNDLERIGDHAVNICQIAQRKIDQKLSFSKNAGEEIGILENEICSMFDLILTALEHNDKTAAKASLSNENRLNRMQVDFRRNHVRRMTEGISTPETGLIFIDFVDNIEKVGDHLTNIAQSVIGGLQWAGLEGNSLTGVYPAISR